VLPRAHPWFTVVFCQTRIVAFYGFDFRPISSPPHHPKTKFKWQHLLGCPTDDGAFACLFGPLGDIIVDDAATPSTSPVGPETVAAVLYLWLVGAQLPSPSHHRNETHISVHIRMGDTCNRVVYEPRPNQNGDRWAVETIGHCVHWSVYLKRLLEINVTRPISSLRVATDDHEAIEGIQKVFPGVIYVPFNRTIFHVPQALGKKSNGGHRYWIDERNDLTAGAVRAGVADMKMLAQGNYFIGGGCSRFNHPAYLAASFLHRQFVPYESLDECSMSKILAQKPPRPRSEFDFRPRPCEFKFGTDMDGRIVPRQ